MTTRQLSDGDPDGTTLGQDSSDKISFYGVTTLSRQTLAMTAITSASTVTAVGNAVVELQNYLKAIGLAQ